MSAATTTPTPSVGSRVLWRSKTATVVWHQPADIFDKAAHPFAVGEVIIEAAKVDMRTLGLEQGKFISGAGPGTADVARPRCVVRLDDTSRDGRVQYAWVMPRSLTVVRECNGSERTEDFWRRVEEAGCLLTVTDGAPEQGSARCSVPLAPPRKCNGGEGIEPCPAHGLDNGYCDEVAK